MKPTIGRIVHYTNLGDADGKYPPEAQAAIITGVKNRHSPAERQASNHRLDNDLCTETCFAVDLHIFYRTGDFFMMDVPFSKTPMTRGHWNWPPKE